MARVPCRGMPATQASIALPARYRVVRHVANGGMASVWAAEDELLGRLVAVKVLSTAYAADERANRRFLREARAAAKLGDCRHVVTVYDIGEHDERPFMVMEYFAGGTVADRLTRGMSIPRPLALRWLREAAVGLDCAHDNDVVHRDVKPANLLLDQRGRLAVGDFGIATVATEASVTQTGQVLGTAAYISPEQARGEPATAASDRYALAVVAFELLTGRRPFDAEHPAAQARAHVEASVPRASAVEDDLPDRVDRVLAAGMAKDWRKRPVTAGALVEALEDAFDDGDYEPYEERATAATAVAAPAPRFARAAPASAGAAPGTSSRGAAPARRWPAVGVVAAILLVAASAVAIALGGRDNGGPDTATSTSSRSAAAGAGSGRHKARAHKAKAHKAKATHKAKPAREATTTTPKAAAPAHRKTTSSAATAAAADNPVALNNEGFALINQGNPTQAVGLLQRSVAAFRQQGSTGVIDYAFALYNLGNALRLSGRPADAIPFLQERLRISDYKRGVVRNELALAREQAGVAPRPANGNGNGHANGKAKGHDKGDGGDGHGGQGKG
jgi:eukaryotic-like serine/threonine-protein kinase